MLCLLERRKALKLQYCFPSVYPRPALCHRATIHNPDKCSLSPNSTNLFEPKSPHL